MTERIITDEDYQLDLTKITPMPTQLTFRNRYKYPIKPGEIPEGVVEVHIGENVEHPLESGVFPSTLKILTFEKKTEHGHALLSGVIPDGVETLALSCFNVQDVSKIFIPPSVTDLTLYLITTEQMNKIVLPESIKKLEVYGFTSESGECQLKIEKGVFSHCSQLQSLLLCNVESIEPGTIPLTVNDLELENVIVTKNIIHEGVKVLHIGTKSLDPGLIPEGVMELKLYGIGNIQKGMIPLSVKKLVLIRIGHITEDSLPPTIKSMVCCMVRKIDSNGFPRDLETLRLYNSFKGNSRPFRTKNIPKGVWDLSVFEFPPKTIHDTYPPRLEKLAIGGIRESLSPGQIPDTVHTLSLSRYEYELTSDIIPESVHTLSLSAYGRGRELTPDIIPKSVVTLTISKYGRDLKKGHIPSHIKTLTLGNVGYPDDSIGYYPSTCSSLSLRYNPLPESLEVLCIKSRVDGMLDSSNLPKSIKELEITRKIEDGLNLSHLSQLEKLEVPDETTIFALPDHYMEKMDLAIDI